MWGGVELGRVVRVDVDEEVKFFVKIRGGGGCQGRCE